MLNVAPLSMQLAKKYVEPYSHQNSPQRFTQAQLLTCVMAGSLLPSSVVASWGPNNDKSEAPELSAKASTVNCPKKLFADAGYDAEWVHEFCRNEWNVESVIKPAVYRSDGRHNGTYRSAMTEATLKEKGYGRRWLVESFMSALKRTTGSSLAARNERCLFVEAALRVLAYAIRR